MDASKFHELYGLPLFFKNSIKLDFIELYAPKPSPENFVPLLSFNVKNHDSEIISAYLDEQGIAVRPGLHCAPSAHKFYNTLDRGAIRVCPSYFTKVKEIDALILALKKFNLK